MEEKAEFLKNNLDKIANLSQNTLLLPIGADHLGVLEDIQEQIYYVNEILEDYEIELGSPFDYFNAVKFKTKYNGELRDNSETFILQGCYSARIKLKQLNAECSYKLDLADKIQMNFGNLYDSSIEYAYKLLLQNQAHDSICGCSTDEVHAENIARYKKILQIANTIIEEIRFYQEDNLSISFKYPDKYKILEVERPYISDNAQVISKRKGFETRLLHDTNRIPITEDYTTLYKQVLEFNSDSQESDLAVNDVYLCNSKIKLEVINGKLNLYQGKKCYENFIEFIRCKDKGDTYNFAPELNDIIEKAQIKGVKVLMDGPLRSMIRITTSFFQCGCFS